jgi:hypothetical protein
MVRFKNKNFKKGSEIQKKYDSLRMKLNLRNRHYIVIVSAVKPKSHQKLIFEVKTYKVSTCICSEIQNFRSTKTQDSRKF